MIGLFFTLLKLAIIGGVFAFLAWEVSRSVLVGAGLVLSLFLARTVLVDLPGLVLFIHIYPQDAVFVLIALAAAWRASFWGRLCTERALVLFLFALVGVNFLLGVQTYGLKPAGVGARGTFYFLSSILYFMSFDYDIGTGRKIVGLWLGATPFVVLLGVYKWLAPVVGLPVLAGWSRWHALGSSMRVLHARAVFFLAQAFFLALFFDLEERNRGSRRYFKYALLPMVLLLQHRSVWAATLVGLLLVSWKRGKIRGRLASGLSVGALAGVVITLVVFGRGIESVGASLRRSVVEPARQHSTIRWRVEGWKAFLSKESMEGPTAWVFGRGFGAGWDTETAAGVRNVSPHNFYVQTILQMGLIGLVPLLMLHVLILRRTTPWKMAAPLSDAERGLEGFGVIIAMHLVFFIVYAPHYEYGLLLGMAMAMGQAPVAAESHSWNPKTKQALPSS